MDEKIKIKITLSDFTVEFEGKGSFLNEHLDDLVSKISKVPRSSKIIDEGEDVSFSTKPTHSLKLSTNDVASKLGVKPKEGLKLMWAAITKLAVIDNMKTFSVDNIRNEMKSSSFWDAGMSANIRKNIKRQAKGGKLLNPNKDMYAVPPDEITTLSKCID